MKASDATGTSIKHLETAANAAMPVGSVRRNASETAVKLLKDGNMKIYVAQIFNFQTKHENVTGNLSYCLDRTWKPMFSGTMFLAPGSVPQEIF